MWKSQSQRHGDALAAKTGPEEQVDDSVPYIQREY